MKTDNCTFIEDKEPVRSKLNYWLEIGLVLLIVFAISMVILSASNPKTNPPGRDGGFFLYVGKAIKSGAKLYVDIWDSKGPMIFGLTHLVLVVITLVGASSLFSCVFKQPHYSLLIG